MPAVVYFRTRLVMLKVRYFHFQCSRNHRSAKRKKTEESEGMKVSDLLKEKGGQVITVSPEASIFEAMRLLVENKIGSLVVRDDEGKLVGILSERDILKAAFEGYDSLKAKKVTNLMTTNLIVAIPEDDLEYIKGIMTVNHIRHLPIVTRDGIVGIVSIGDIVKYQLQETQVQNRYLEEYMFGQ